VQAGKSKLHFALRKFSSIFLMGISPANALALAASGARGPGAPGNTAQANQPAVPGRAERSRIAFAAPKAVDAIAYITAEALVEPGKPLDYFATAPMPMPGGFQEEPGLLFLDIDGTCTASR
jgi:hypothetical protein